MSGFASHLLTVLFQQILLIAAVAAAFYVVIRQRATTQSRTGLRRVRVPVESRQLRRGREATDDTESHLGHGGRASFHYAGLPDRDSVRARDPLVDDRP